MKQGCMKRNRTGLNAFTMLTIIVMLGCLLGLTGCTNRDNLKTENAQDMQAAGQNADNTDSADNADDSAPTGDRASTDTESKPYTWEEITVLLPASWEGKYIADESENGVSFRQKSSDAVEPGSGFICGFYRYPGMIFSGAGETQLAYTEDEMYYLQEPTDVPYALEVQAVADEYGLMAAEIGAIADSLKVDKADVRYDAREFVLPMSDTMALTRQDLVNLDADSLSTARNEIYARHGKRFQNYYIQRHFDTCSWYAGEKETIEDSVLSDLELSNIEQIKAAEMAYKEEHPYPMAVLCAQGGNFPLLGEENADATMMTVDYQAVWDDTAGDYDAVLTIDGEKYKLSDFNIYMENPEMEKFFITDINPYMAGLEIAVIDYGNNDWNRTFFFSYPAAGKLKLLGEITGCPFKEINGAYDGFRNMGCVYGTKRIDLLETVNISANWWYDYDGQQFKEQQPGACPPMAPASVHELYVDLPVYRNMDEQADTLIIHKQKEVFFMGTDGEHWVLVKGKDGTKGYIYVEDMQIKNIDMDANEVFSDLNFAS